VSISTSRINAVLGSTLSATDVEGAFNRLGLPYTQDGEQYTVHVPFERLDITIPEDLIEEVGRIIGYDKIVPVELPAPAQPPVVNANFYAAEHVREELLSQGYSEVFTSVFAEKGERLVANKVDGIRPYLRTNISDGLNSAILKNLSNKELLGLKTIKIFEIGPVWEAGQERFSVAKVEGETKSEGPKVHGWKGSESVLESINASEYEDLPLSTTERYKSFSKYPYIVRDIALWTPKGTEAHDVLSLIQGQAGELMVKADLFDRFEKGEKISLAFRLIFQSFEKTLTDVEVNAIMEKVATTLRERGYEIR
jgi:phenylalanyl-tRNA synthetase beta subunit